jgi:spore germination cell wall hydrolase CwlJ-like protein
MKWLLAILLVAVCSQVATPPPMPPVPSPVVAITPSIRCMAWVIHDEARGEPLRGAKAVLDVVRTRMKKRKKTACQIISAKKQFSGYRRGVFDNVTDKMLARYFEADRMAPVMRGCEYFHANYTLPAWSNDMVRCGRVGAHVFYKEKVK